MKVEKSGTIRFQVIVWIDHVQETVGVLGIIENLTDKILTIIFCPADWLIKRLIGIDGGIPVG